MAANDEKQGATDDSFNQISQALQNNLPEVDRVRATALVDLQFLRTARAEGLQREQARLSTKLGADHPRVAELASMRVDNDKFLSGLAIETERAGVSVPQPDRNIWVLHGFVRDQQLRGVAGVAVALYDASGNWAQQLGYTCTLSNGYFRLDARSLANLRPPLFVHITSQGRPLHTDDLPLTPEAGAVQYHEIVITGAQTCASPGGAGNAPTAEDCKPPAGTGTSPAVPPGGTGDAPVAITPPGGTGNAPVAEAGAWIVRGRVSDKQGKGLSDLIVSLYDKDLFFDDKLGETETDEAGNYSLTYGEEDFRDLIEKNPDIYLKVLDQKGKALYTSKKKLRYEAGRVEILNVEIGEAAKK